MNKEQNMSEILKELLNDYDAYLNGDSSRVTIIDATIPAKSK